MVLKPEYFWQNEVNVMAANALAPYVARASVTMLLAVWDKWVLVFHEERFQPPTPICY